MYIIKYNYNTGDSFKTEHDLDAVLEFKWNNLEQAKKSLKIIKEHYKWYLKLNSSANWRAETRDELLAYAEKQPWYVKKYDFCLKLVDDNDKPFKMSASDWCGYFESLNWAEIDTEKPKDDGMRIEF